MTTKTAFCFDSADYERVQKITSSFGPEIFSLPPLETYLNLSDETLSDETTAQLLADSDMTVVFIGKRTFENSGCLKMIENGFAAGQTFLAVYLNNSEDVKRSGKELLGKNPFEFFYFEYDNNNSNNSNKNDDSNNNDESNNTGGGITTFNSGSVLLPSKLKRRFSSKNIKAKADFIVTYDYIKDGGAENLLKWIEEERQRKIKFFTECDKIKENEWDSALKVTFKGGIAGFFLYYHWLTYSERKKGMEKITSEKNK